MWMESLQIIKYNYSFYISQEYKSNPLTDFIFPLFNNKKYKYTK